MANPHIFSLTQLAKNINDIFGDTFVVTKQELSQPKPDMVQRLVREFLLEFEFSENFTTQNHTCIELVRGNLSNEIADTLPLDLLAVATRKLFQRIHHRTLSSEFTFGVMDLINPDPKRIKTFLSQLV